MGGVCNGSSLVGLVRSTWAEEGELLRLTSCEAGYILVRGNDASQDQCFRCPGLPLPGYYSLQPAVFPGELSLTFSACNRSVSLV